MAGRADSAAPAAPDLAIAQPGTAEELAAVAELFREYAAWLGEDLCLANFDQEMDAFPDSYRALLLATAGGAPMGAVGLMQQDAQTLEIKRLYRRPAARGLGLGSALARRCVEEARALGAACLTLSTLPRMTGARAIYRDLGFVEAAPSESGVIVMTLPLCRAAAE